MSRGLSGAPFVPGMPWAVRNGRLTINALAARPIRTARLPIGEIATDGVDLFSGPEIERLKECARQDCGLLFVDRSHSGRRRWCDMEACGNRAKTSVYRARRRTSSPA